MSNLLISIVIVGKPNVGKSTLFNTMLGRKEAITGKDYGLTRDYQEAVCTHKGLTFKLIDTAGYNIKKDIFIDKLNQLTLSQIKNANIILFLIDGSNNLTADDNEIWKLLNKSGKKVILLVNKSELKTAKNFNYQFNEFGIEDCANITALSKSCIDKIFNIIKANTSYLSTKKKSINEIQKSYDESIRISIVGKPNVGKSTLYNLLYGKERVMTASIAGTTRDSIMSALNYKKYLFELIDTAGLRKKGRINLEVDKASAYYSRKEIRYANCVILVIDAQYPLSNQDIFLSNYIIKEGRSILLIFNKWDLVNNKKIKEKELLKQIDDVFFDAKGINVLFISSLEKHYREKIFKKIIDVYLSWNKKINTSILNKWLQSFWKKSGNAKYSSSLKLKYISQSKIRPPSFIIYHNKNSKIPKVTKRYITNQIREKFKLQGTPIRVNLRSSVNPYIKGKKK